jgi:hypothetical protein
MRIARKSKELNATHLRNAASITVRFAAWYRGAALHISKTTVAMAMLDFETFDQHHDTCASIRTVIDAAFLSISD